jgi:4-amino-4-deoxy-L-arabinose transferase-like glycosyltransferase
VSDAIVESSPEQPVALESGAIVVGTDAGADAAIETNAVPAAARPGILEGLGIAGRLGVSERAAFWLGIAGIVAVAALLRVGNLSTRGTWDADQGHDMLVLRDLVQRGQVPLLGPPTSIGDFHHGVLYYVLLAPAAAISGADPVGVTLAIALAGIAAVAVTAWLGRAIGGTTAGLVAGLLMAVSASAVDESTFIWNPNLIALSSSIALAAAWHAWQARRPRWWIVAGAAAVVTMHLHVLGVVLTPVIAGLLVADLVRRRQSGDPDGTPEVVSAIGWWIVLAVASYVPLAIHEAQSGASELRAAAAFLLGSGEPAATSLPARLPIVGLRVLGWPLTGLITAAPIATLLSSTLVVVLAIWRGWLVRPRTDAAVDERTGIRWLGAGLAWTIAGLAVGASSLATVVLGLPNDHYHAFADPMVFVVVGVGVAALLRMARSAARSGPEAVLRRAAAISAAALVVVLVGWNLLHEPPAVAADGGWPAARIAAVRIFDATGGKPVTLESLPAVKSADAVRFPLERVAPGIVADAAPSSAAGSPARVILCDQLFHESIGADCGGPAEDVLARQATSGAVTPPLIDRFEAAPGRWISIYAAAS